MHTWKRTVPEDCFYYFFSIYLLPLGVTSLYPCHPPLWHQLSACPPSQHRWIICDLPLFPLLAAPSFIQYIHILCTSASLTLSIFNSFLILNFSSASCLFNNTWIIIFLNGSYPIGIIMCFIRSVLFVFVCQMTPLSILSWLKSLSVFDRVQTSCLLSRWWYSMENAGKLYK